MRTFKVYILIANRLFHDGIRSGLGLTLENHYVYPVVMNDKFDFLSGYMQENINWISEMGGQVFTCATETDEDSADLKLSRINLEELGELLRDADFIIPYGLPTASYAPPACSRNRDRG